MHFWQLLHQSRYRRSYDKVAWAGWQTMPKKFNDEASFNSVIDAYRTVHQRCPNFRLDQQDLPESMRQAIEQGAARPSEIP